MRLKARRREVEIAMRYGVCSRCGGEGVPGRTTWHRANGVRFMQRLFTCGRCAMGWTVDIPAPPGGGPS